MILNTKQEKPQQEATQYSKENLSTAQFNEAKKLFVNAVRSIKVFGLDLQPDLIDTIRQLAIKKVTDDSILYKF